MGEIFLLLNKKISTILTIHTAGLPEIVIYKSTHKVPCDIFTCRKSHCTKDLFVWYKLGELRDSSCLKVMQVNWYDMGMINSLCEEIAELINTVSIFSIDD